MSQFIKVLLAIDNAYTVPRGYQSQQHTSG